MHGQHKIIKPMVKNITPLPNNVNCDSPKHMYGEVFLLQPLVNNVPKYHGSFPDINFTLKLSLLPFASYGTLIYAVGINWLFDESHIHH